MEYCISPASNIAYGVLYLGMLVAMILMLVGIIGFARENKRLRQGTPQSESQTTAQS